MGANGQFTSLPRESYNYFIADQNPGPGPYTFRITDIHGHVLTDSGIPFAEAAEQSGAAQFPACP